MTIEFEDFRKPDAVVLIGADRPVPNGGRLF